MKAYLQRIFICLLFYISCEAFVETSANINRKIKLKHDKSIFSTNRFKSRPSSKEHINSTIWRRKTDIIQKESGLSLIFSQWKNSVPTTFAGASLLIISLFLGEECVSAAEKLQPQFYQQQIQDTFLIKTIRGKWRIREFRPQNDGGACRADITFRGFVDQPTRGVLSYEGCGKKGTGNWLLKPKRLYGREVEFSARWKVNFSDGTSFIYKGDVEVSGFLSNRPDANIEGDILLPVKSVAGTLSEKKTGATFQADLLQVLDDVEKL